MDLHRELPADLVVASTTRPDQALLYRLSGDRNPLHSDQAFAANAGLDKPILHGSCTFGFSGRALLSGVCDGDPTRFGVMGGRFVAPVVPGECLETHIWKTDEGVVFRAQVAARVVFDGGTFVAR